MVDSGLVHSRVGSLNTSHRGRLDLHQGNQHYRRSSRPRCSVHALPDKHAHPESLIWGDTPRAMQRRLITGHSPFEAVAGFSRAVVVGSTVYVAGTAPIPPDGSPTPEGAYDQARLCLALIAEALERAGSSVENVVRTRMFVTDAAHWGDVSRAHGEVFGEVRPAATCVVTSLLDASWKVEIEADAVMT